MTGRAPAALAAAGLAAALALALGPAERAGAAAPAPAGTVTFVAGEATRAAGGEGALLAVGSPVYPGDVVETRSRTRLELRLGDGSVLRLGPLSRLVVEAARFGGGPAGADRAVSARLRIGSLWARVAKALGGGSTFEVQTGNAVAGVRGTTFRVEASGDRSVVVKVYAGAVAVASAGEPPPGGEAPAPPGRRRVPGPREVTRAEWERIVTGMMLVRVSPDGAPGEPEPFALAAAGEDAFEAWNRARDAEQGIAE